MSTSVSAGWYHNPDQNKPGTLRWWDGAEWTDHIHTDFSQTDPKRLSKTAARETVAQMQQTIHKLEDFISRNGLRKILDFEEWEKEKLSEFEAKKHSYENYIWSLENNRKILENNVNVLSQHVISLETAHEMQTVGLFDFDHPAEDSTQLATWLASVRTQIKDAIRNKTAVAALSTFTFNNSAAQGKKFVNALTKLMLRAYNAEAENAIKTTRAGNLQTAQARLTRAADQIAKNGEMVNLHITQHFHNLRLQEIELAYRHLKAQQIEKELERERRAELREQRKAEQELRKEQERLEKEKSHYQATLAALRANGNEDGVARILEKIEDVDKAINDVDYRAANIRAGYVYVISNVGSFGPNVVKIGMTRRLDPMERVRELGDASVPFKFDVHALFFADDAITIESMLHKEFSHVRINQVNMRREYFETTPEQVLAKLQEHHVELLEYVLEPQAEEYRESQQIRASKHVGTAEALVGYVK